MIDLWADFIRCFLVNTRHHQTHKQIYRFCVLLLFWFCRFSVDLLYNNIGHYNNYVKRVAIKYVHQPLCMQSLVEMMLFSNTVYKNHKNRENVVLVCARPNQPIERGADLSTEHRKCYTITPFSCIVYGHWTQSIQNS